MNWNKWCSALCKTRGTSVTLVKGKPYKGYNNRRYLYRAIPFGRPIPENSTIVRRFIPKAWAERPIGHENYNGPDVIVVK